jgi:hypothetical protein
MCAPYLKSLAGSQAFLADLHDLDRCSLGLLAEDVENHDRIRRDEVNDSPRLVMIADS